MAITDERMAVLDDIPDGVTVKLDVLGQVVTGQVLFRDKANGTPVVNVADDLIEHNFPWGFRKQTRVVEIVE